MITIYYAKSSDFQDEIPLTDLLTHLPVSFQERALRYQFAQDAYNFVLGRLLLKAGLKHLNLSVDKLEKINYNKEEKPWIEGLSFSISHSKDLVACAFSKTGAIGLDIEFPRSMKKDYFRHSFNDQEWVAIQEDETMQTFYQYWTQKEAILKANGAGLAHLLAIRMDGSLAYFGNKKEPFYLKLIQFDGEEAHACLCTDKEVRLSLEKKSINDLIIQN